MIRMIYKTPKIVVIILCVTLIFSSCAEDVHQSAAMPSLSSAEPMESMKPEENEAKYRKISAKEARDMMEAAEMFLLLDVRTVEEFEEQRIPGSVLLPDYEISNGAKDALPDKNALIFLYCRSGRRSASAAKLLVDMGYKNVYDFGGIIHWPYETEGDLVK